MKTVYENFNDLKEAAEKFGFGIARLSSNRAAVWDLEGKPMSYTRGENGGWIRGGDSNG